MAARIDLTGKKLGKWLVLGPKSMPNASVRWLCRCECGIEKIVVGQSLRMGVSQSCGCLRNKLTSERCSTHRLTGTIIYSRWAGMLARCKKDAQHAHCYFDRGIFVCKEWHDFNNFYRDMGEAFKEDLTLERIDTDKGYYKENCRWATMKEQNNNYRTSKIRFKDGKWIAQLTKNGKQRILGVFKSRLLAENCWQAKVADLIKSSKQDLLKNRNGVSGHRGVYFTNDRRWSATMTIDGFYIPLGSFNTKEQAAEAYIKAAEQRTPDASSINPRCVHR